MYIYVCVSTHIYIYTHNSYTSTAHTEENTEFTKKNSAVRTEFRKKDHYRKNTFSKKYQYNTKIDE